MLKSVDWPDCQNPNITDIVFPTAWVDEWPFLVATEVQNGWAVSNRVNFLASGYHAPDKNSK